MRLGVHPHPRTIIGNPMAICGQSAQLTGDPGHVAPSIHRRAQVGGTRLGALITYGMESLGRIRVQVAWTPPGASHL